MGNLSESSAKVNQYEALAVSQKKKDEVVKMKGARIESESQGCSLTT